MGNRVKGFSKVDEKKTPRVEIRPTAKSVEEMVLHVSTFDETFLLFGGDLIDKVREL